MDPPNGANRSCCCSACHLRSSCLILRTNGAQLGGLQNRRLGVRFPPGLPFLPVARSEFDECCSCFLCFTTGGSAAIDCRLRGYRRITKMATSRADVPSSTADNLKTAVAVAVVIIALVAFYMFADQSLLMRVLALLVAGGVAVALYYQTERGRRTVGFFRDARTEVRKVVWPSRQETMQTTLTVFVIVVIIGIFLWLLDMVLSGLFKMITGIG